MLLYQIPIDCIPAIEETSKSIEVASKLCIEVASKDLILDFTEYLFSEGNRGYLAICLTLSVI